ncbi:TIGR04219 family outer membrane beta-barrel protein [Pseudoalteromonas xiamenensis]|uniref:TIGR04219 family outer membrane beta-barrel protein n=1 Tax=Pseudoalteromonas xiamenensis TaxID=882626 RepID=A0A975HLK5_9GAMM|nr:TIGR04219 family outer membrane beta-barrel protein [Pseudoalteromonas xiamenensis]QTH70135.1 TIGR04219 family outer membrane beta-barrel protein [Pseudoalteromonas xiamenensis]WMN58387.1 TIGR04219 family outer membrane beta-barrel protein [Pseudoalteromonas xiamenensis]
MKKLCLALALATAGLAPVAHADTLLGLYVGGEGWKTSNEGSFANKGNLQKFNFEDETFTSYYAALEHPIPLVPNIKLKHTELEITGSTTLSETFEFGGTEYRTNTAATTVSDLTHNDIILYYELFDNDLVSIDFGVNVKQFDGEITVKGEDQATGNMTTERVDFSGYVPMGYLRGEVGMPFTGLSLFAEGSVLSISGSSIQDYQVGVAWAFVENMAVDVAVRAGYRSLQLELDDIDDIDTDLDFSGPFLGLELHF